MALKSKKNNRKNTMTNDVDSVVLKGVLSVLKERATRQYASVWNGTMTDLNSALVRVLGRKESVMLPGSPGSLRVVLNRIVNRLRTRSVSVRFGRTTDHSRTRYVKFTQ